MPGRSQLWAFRIFRRLISHFQKTDKNYHQEKAGCNYLAPGQPCDLGPSLHWRMHYTDPWQLTGGQAGLVESRNGVWKGLFCQIGRAFVEIFSLFFKKSLLRSIINAEAIFIMVIAMRWGGIIDQLASRRKVKLYETLKKYIFY